MILDPCRVGRKGFFLVFAAIMAAGAAGYRLGAQPASVWQPAPSLALAPPVLIITDHAGQASVSLQRDRGAVDERERPWVNWNLLGKALDEAISRVRPQQPRRVALAGFAPTSRYPHEPHRKGRIRDPARPLLEQWVEPNSPLSNGQRWVWLQWHTLQWNPEEPVRPWFAERRRRWPERAPVRLGGKLYEITDLILVQDLRTGKGKILIKPEGESDLLQFSYKGAAPTPFREWLVERAGRYALKELFPPAHAYRGDWDDHRTDPETAWDLLSRAVMEAVRHVQQGEPEQVPMNMDEFLATQKKPRIDESRPVIPQLLEEQPPPFPWGWPAPRMTWSKPVFDEPEWERQYEERQRRYAPWFKHEAVPVFLGGKWYRITDLLLIQGAYSGKGVVVIQPENGDHLLRFSFEGASPYFFTAWFLLNHDYYGRVARSGD